MKIMITDFVWPNVDIERKLIERNGHELIVSPNSEPETLKKLIKDVDAILFCFADINSDILQSAKNCKVACRYGIGVDNIDIKKATELGIVITNIPDYCLDEVSDHVMAMLLNLNRSIMPHDQLVKQGLWHTVKKEENLKNKTQAEIEKIEKLELSPYEKRLMKFSVLPIQNMYDERCRVPLIFSGYNIPSGVLISEQVRSVDIFSTIADIVGLNNINENKRDRSLLPLMQGKHFDELPVYIESAINAAKSLTDNTIGIRTSEFKYFRDKNDATKNVHLYDLRKDQLEENNIANNKNDVVTKMEKILLEILKNGNSKERKSYEEIDGEQSEIIESELKKLGYIN